MRFQTTRFGEIEAADEQVIHFPWGLPGFTEQKRFVPIQYSPDGSLSFLQAVDMPELTFIIADPFKYIGNYVVDIPQEDLQALELTSPEEALVYVILTVRQGGREVTANLVAPLVINRVKQKGRQVILFNSPYNSRYPLTSNMAKAQAK